MISSPLRAANGRAVDRDRTAFGSRLRLGCVDSASSSARRASSASSVRRRRRSIGGVGVRRSCAAPTRGRRTGIVAFDAWADLGRELLGEQRQRRVDRRRTPTGRRSRSWSSCTGTARRSSPSRSLDACGHVARADRLADLEDLVEVVVGAVAVDDALEDPRTATCRPRGTARTCRTTRGRRTCTSVSAAAGMSVVSSITITAPEPSIEPAAPTGWPSNGRSSWSGGEPRRRSAAGHERLQLVAVADALAELVAVEQVAERGRAVDDLEHAGPLDVARTRRPCACRATSRCRSR